MEENRSKNKEISIKTKSLASFAAFGTILVGLLTVAAGLFTTNNTLKINSLKETFAVQTSKENTLNDAMVSIREFLLIEQENCINGRYDGDLKKLRKSTIKIIFPLVKQIMNSEEIFDLDTGQKFQRFISMAYDQKNICSRNFPKEKEFIRLNRELILKMRHLSDKTRRNILYLESKILGVF